MTDINAMMNCCLSGSSITVGDFQPTTASNYWPETVWDFWQDEYYPKVVKVSYPVYLQERAMDKGQKAFEIIKILQDKKMVKMEKVSDFIDLMDALIKIL